MNSVRKTKLIDKFHGDQSIRGQHVDQHVPASTIVACEGGEVDTVNCTIYVDCETNRVSNMAERMIYADCVADRVHNMGRCTFWSKSWTRPC